MTLDRARSLAAQGYPEDALELLIDFVERAEIPELMLDLDDRGALTLEHPFDPPFMEALRKIKGVRRDKAAGLWRVPGKSFGALADLIERLALPFCSALGCSLIDQLPPSQAHREAHERCCVGLEV